LLHGRKTKMNDSNKRERKTTDIFAIVSLVLGAISIIGIIGLVFSFLPFESGIFHEKWNLEIAIAVLSSFIGLIFRIFTISKSSSLSRWGTALCIIGFSFSVICWVLSTIRTPF
jgi:hypothetical protein